MVTRLSMYIAFMLGIMLNGCNTRSNIMEIDNLSSNNPGASVGYTPMIKNVSDNLEKNKRTSYANLRLSVSMFWTSTASVSCYSYFGWKYVLGIPLGWSIFAALSCCYPPIFIGTANTVDQYCNCLCRNVCNILSRKSQQAAPVDIEAQVGQEQNMPLPIRSHTTTTMVN